MCGSFDFHHIESINIHTFISIKAFNAKRSCIWFQECSTHGMPFR